MLRDPNPRRWDVAAGVKGWPLRRGRRRSSRSRWLGGHRRPGVKKAPTPVVSHTCGTREPRQSPGRCGGAVGQPEGMAESSGGNRMPKKRMPVGESRQETATSVAAPPGGRCGVTGRIPGHGARVPKGTLTWAGELRSGCWSIRRNRRASWTPYGERTCERRLGVGRHRLAPS
jgi:hypothetical protein